MDLSVARELDSPTVISDEVGGETLAINLGTGSYFVIPASAQPVWRAVSGGVPAQLLLDSPSDERLTALTSFVATMVNAGLLREAEQPAPAPIDQPQWSAEDVVVEEHTDMADLLGLDPIHDADESVGWPMAKQPDAP